MELDQNTKTRPLTAAIRFISDGRFLNVVFLAMLGLTVATVGIDLREMMASAPQGVPGSQQLEPAPMEFPKPGDQRRTYLPKTMPLGPNRSTPKLPGFSAPLDSAAMGGAIAFYKGTDGDYSAVGTITPGSAARMREFLADNEKQIGRLFLHSPGGSVTDALEMSKMIRQAGISTVVPANGYCASSCPLVLSGGLYRSTGKNAWVGVHQIYAADGTVGSLQRGMADAQSISAVCQTHLDTMGVDPKLWVYAMQTPSASLYVLTAKQIRDLRVANTKKPTTLPTLRPGETG